MAEKKTIELEVKSNIGGSISELKALKRELKNAAVGSEDFKRIFNQIDDLEDKIKSAKNTSSDWVDSLENAGGPLGMLGASINKAKVATQSFGGALKATGIGLIVALLGGLAAAFSENEGAMKKLQPLLDGLSKIFQGVFRAVEPLFNTMVDLAMKALPYVTKGIGMVYSAMMGYFTFLKESGTGALKILKGVFTLDTDTIKEGMNQIGGSFKKTAQSYSESMKRFTDGSKELTKSEKLSAEERQKLRDKEIADKKAKDEENARNAAKALEKKKKDDEAYIQSILDRLKKEQDIKDGVDANLAELEAADAAAKETARQAEVNRQVEAGKTLENQLKYKKSLNDKEIEDEKAKLEAKRAIQEAQLNLASQGIGFLKDIAGKNVAIQKAALIAESAVAIARIIINTRAANAKAVALSPATFGQPIVAINTISGVLSVASTLLATKKALTSLGGGSAPSAPSLSGGGGGGGGGAEPAQSAAPQFNVVGTSGANQIAQTLGNQAPVKAYVVSNDVTTAQGLDRNIVKTATLGG